MTEERRITIAWRRDDEGRPEGRVRCQGRACDFSGWTGLLAALTEVAEGDAPSTSAVVADDLRGERDP